MINNVPYLCVNYKNVTFENTFCHRIDYHLSFKISVKIPGFSCTNLSVHNSPPKLSMKTVWKLTVHGWNCP